MLPEPWRELLLYIGGALLVLPVVLLLTGLALIAVGERLLRRWRRR